MLLLQSRTICKSLADFVTQLDIAMVNRVKDYFSIFTVFYFFNMQR